MRSTKACSALLAGLVLAGLVLLAGLCIAPQSPAPPGSGAAGAAGAAPAAGGVPRSLAAHSLVPVAQRRRFPLSPLPRLPVGGATRAEEEAMGEFRTLFDRSRVSPPPKGAGGEDLGHRLREAAADGDKEEVERLLKQGVNANMHGKGGWTPLHEAAKKGHKEVAGLLLHHGARVDAASSDGQSPLHTAARWGHREMAELLLGHGAEVDAVDSDGQSPLHKAASWGHTKVAELLLDRGANAKQVGKGGTPLHMAAKHNHEEVAELLLDRGADVDAAEEGGWRPLHDAAGRGHLEVAGLLLQHGANVDAASSDGQTPLDSAAFEGHKEMAELLLDHGAEVDVVDHWHKTPLIKAAVNGHEEVAELLVDRGANVERLGKGAWTRSQGVAPVDPGEAKDLGHRLRKAAREGDKEEVERLLDQGANASSAGGLLGWTPLHEAAWQGHTEVAGLLLHHGAKVDAASSNGQSPLHAAAWRGQREMAELLLDHGAKIDFARSTDGQTPLHLATQEGHKEVAELLLDQGAEVNAVDHSGQSPLHKAAWWGKKELADLFVNSGADKWARDPGGFRPVDLAILRGQRKEMVDLLNLTPQEKYTGLIQHMDFWLMVSAVVSAVVVAALWECIQMPGQGGEPTVLNRYLALETEGQGSGAAVAPNTGGPSRGALLQAAKSLVPAQRQWAAKLFRMMEVFCNTVLPMRLMLNVSVTTWLPALALAYLLPDILWGHLASLPQQPLAVLLTGSRQSLLGARGSWSLRTWAFTALGAVRLILVVAAYKWLAPSAFHWWGRHWWENVNGIRAVYFLTLDEYEERVCLPFDLPQNFENCALLPHVDKMWAYANLGGGCVAALWLVAVFLLIIVSAAQHCFLEEAPGGHGAVRTLAMKVDRACGCGEADGNAYPHEHLEKISAKPFEFITMCPPGGIIVDAGSIFIDVFLDLVSVNAMLLRGDAKFAVILLLASAVSTTRQLARGMFRKLCRDVKDMRKTGVPTELFLEFLDQERGTEALVSLLVSAYALPFAAQTPTQAILAALSLASSTYGVAMLLHAKLDLEGLELPSDKCSEPEAERAVAVVVAEF